ncbi:hypothetical protein DL762_001459 [Monosporascus cannonballus]|uniref:ER membrane protein complex subunit 7 beta-sandwich domain-containing protein n=1 Tax=Monosporascus cannonballus TaxID=155416 RepID=A0ABY0HIM8_9PEZI|nr:hypothetical protein DL763_007393 [Monosporascus cannonballus]RYO92753.1 hypothetical protein DL762_001459 [Monosporascus cannonballus]
MHFSRLPLTVLSLLLLGGGGGIFAAASSTVEITLAIPASPPHLPNPHALPAGDRTRATLARLGASYAVPLSAAGTFVFRNVTPGSYLADVHSATHGFAPLRIDVDAGPGGETRGVRAWETFRGNAWENRGEEVRRTAPGGAFPVRVLGTKTFFVERGSFSVFGILKNPMILMSLVSLGLFIGLPKLMENMDPEMRAEFEKQQQSNPMNSLMSAGQPSGGNFDVAGFLAGHKKEEGAAGGETSSTSGGGKKGGKR